ncbi:MAG: DUF1449 family protein [Candidatus Riflebacteria bacterium]|nr:DUF1449 family protein [Candidatus Riflebacteria bacterium]
MEWLAWWNLLFELPIAGACLLSVVATMGADASADAPHDADASVEHDTDVGHEAPLEAGHVLGVKDALGDAAHAVDSKEALAGGGHGADAKALVSSGHGSVATGAGPCPPASHDVPWLTWVLALPGADRAPLSFVLIVLSVSFGLIGLVANRLLSGLLPPLAFVWISLAVAGSMSLLVTRTFARTLGRFLPRMETYALTRADCVGQVGKITCLLSPREGYAQVYDPQKNFLEVRVVARGQTTFSQGGQVLLLEYEEINSRFVAEPFNPELGAST